MLASSECCARCRPEKGCNPHMVVLLERISLVLAAVPADRRDVQHAGPELDEGAPAS